MKSNTIQYPRPVLNEYLKDFLGCHFEINVPSVEVKDDAILIRLSYVLQCPGMEQFIADKHAKAIVRMTCRKTSYRDIFELEPNETIEIAVDKKKVSEAIEIKGIVIATESYRGYRLEEFNDKYFGGIPFVLRKGDVLAEEPEITIKFASVLEKMASGVVQIAEGDSTVESLKVKYATTEETDPQYANYITILLPKKEYSTYLRLTQKKHLKHGIERFLHAGLILPAIAEAITLLIREELYDNEGQEERYIGTIWADSIIASLKQNGIDDIVSTQKTAVEMANIILGDVTTDSLNDLMEKMMEWSTIRHEEDI